MYDEEPVVFTLPFSHIFHICIIMFLTCVLLVVLISIRIDPYRYHLHFFITLYSFPLSVDRMLTCKEVTSFAFSLYVCVV